MGWVAERTIWNSDKVERTVALADTTTLARVLANWTLDMGTVEITLRNTNHPHTPERQYTHSDPEEGALILFDNREECFDLADGGPVWHRQVRRTPWERCD